MKKSIRIIITFLFIIVMITSYGKVYANEVNLLSEKQAVVNKELSQQVTGDDVIKTIGAIDSQENERYEALKKIDIMNKVMTVIIVAILSIMIVLIVVLSGKKGKK